MQFQTPLIRATLVRRYKRFLADIILPDGREVVAHCANPGAMTGLNMPGATIWVEPNDDPKRKLRFSWKLVEIGTDWACIDTALPNELVAEALAQRQIPELAIFDTLKREVKYGENSRIDFLLNTGGLNTYVEVKAVSLKRDGWAEFPDSVTKRGTKHLNELAKMVVQGHRSVMVYLVQRTDCIRFRLAADIDPSYAAAFTRASDAGVEMLCLATEISPYGMLVAGLLPIDPPQQK
ncbi:MAG: DNA/RNA nuclease SfsA [Proteobacteria bacterium]|nr:DNA/RNA nuclease SfsA [Pseudomonadota bacterium]MDA1285215.1 DNA/RNA nuclease SfsA [Pseudomonadota bacterium]